MSNHKRDGVKISYYETISDQVTWKQVEGPTSRGSNLQLRATVNPPRAPGMLFPEVGVCQVLPIKVYSGIVVQPMEDRVISSVSNQSPESIIFPGCKSMSGMDFNGFLDSFEYCFASAVTNETFTIYGAVSIPVAAYESVLKMRQQCRVANYQGFFRGNSILPKIANELFAAENDSGKQAIWGKRVCCLFDSDDRGCAIQQRAYFEQDVLVFGMKVDYNRAFCDVPIRCNKSQDVSFLRRIYTLKEVCVECMRAMAMVLTSGDPESFTPQICGVFAALQNFSHFLVGHSLREFAKDFWFRIFGTWHRTSIYDVVY